MNKQEFTGRDLQEALSKAAKSLGVHASQVTYEIVKPEKRGLLARVFNRQVTILAYAEVDHAQLQEAARQAVLQALNREPHVKTKGVSRKSPVVTSQERSSKHKVGNEGTEVELFHAPLSTEARGFLQDFTSRFARALGASDLSVTLKEDSDNLDVTFADEMIVKQFASSEKLRGAFDHLLRRLAQRHNVRLPPKLRLNGGEAEKAREQRLRAFAKDIAEKVKRSGKPVTLPFRSSYERRIIHMVVDQIDGVNTRSIGAGDQRKLIVYTDQPPTGDNQRQQKSSSKTSKSTAAAHLRPQVS